MTTPEPDDRLPLSLERIRELILAEEDADADTLHLTANETVLSPLAQAAAGSPLQSRYLLEHLDMRGDSPSRLGNLLFRGMNGVNEIERSSTEVCRRLFGADYAEFRCLSGLHAMQTSFVALSAPGDNVMRVSTKDGGHFLTELICRGFGRRSCTYAFRDVGEIDLDRTREVIERERPSLLYIDAMNYLFPFPLTELKQMAGSAPLVYDASHTLGLIAGGQFQDPLREGADILQANTHKTFFGPQKALIVGNDRGLMERISYTLSNGMVSSQHTASALALFVALHEMYADGRHYAAQVVENARTLADALHRRGVPVVAAERGFTRNHVIFVDTRTLGSGMELLARVVRAGISVNRSIAFNQLEALRLGVQEVTRRGYTAEDLDRVADWLAELLLGRAEPEAIRPEVVALVRSRRNVRYTGGQTGRPARTPVAALGAAGPATARRPAARPTVVEPEPATGSEPVAAGAGAAVPRPTGGRPRWTRIALDRGAAGIEPELVAGARELGQLAGGFEHQIDSAGNISVMAGDRMFVTASGAYIKDLAAEDFVEIVGMDGWTLACRGGGPPSVESYLHYLIRQTVPAGVVVHNHYIPAFDLERMDVLVLPPKEYGSVELAEAVAEAAPRSQRMYVRRHGLVFWAEKAEDCADMLTTAIDSVGGMR